MDDTYLRHPVHGDDRQSAIRMDAFRQSHCDKARLVDRRCPGSLQHLHCARDLAYADRGLDCRPARRERIEDRGRVRRDHGRPRLGHKLICRYVDDAIHRRCCRRHGGGAVYATCVGLAVKWFPDRRGLAVGLTAAGYGAGAALTVIPIRHVIAISGYEAAFLWFGLFQGGIVFLLSWFLRAPEPSEMIGVPAAKVTQSSRNYAPNEVLSSPVFWLLYVMFVMVSASGLMATAQIAPIAKDFNVANTLVFFGASTLTAALIIDSVANGSARPVFGWISDQIGREYTMAIAFG